MLRWLYPETCQLCGEQTSGLTLCDACRAALPRVPRPICLYCGAPVGNAERDNPFTCPSCEKRHRMLAFMRSALGYSDTALSLVHDLKYHNASHLAPALAPVLAEMWEEHALLREYDDWVLVPVPIQADKLYDRGYNQAEELALALARLKGLRVLQPLRRVDTGIRSQTRLTATLREYNARRAYSALPAYAAGHRSLPPRLLLVDDVLTTGATLRACAAALARCRRDARIGALSLMRMA